MYLQSLRRWVILCLMLLPAAIAGAADTPLNVYAVNYPLAYFAERIGGPHVRVTLPIPADVDPVYWTPTIADIGAYQQADLILLNGAGYAKWTTTVSLPRSRSVDTSRKLKDRYITVTEVTTHSHGAEGEHAHEGLAFTTWLDFSMAAAQADAVFRALVRKLPEAKSALIANRDALIGELKEMDRRMQAVVAKNPDLPLVVSHPVYQYLTRRYGMNTKAVHWEPDAAPSDGQVAELQGLLNSHSSQWMIWENTPVSEAREKLTEIGMQSTVFNPCGNVPESGDFMTVMKKNIQDLESVYQ